MHIVIGEMGGIIGVDADGSEDVGVAIGEGDDFDGIGDAVAHFEDMRDACGGEGGDEGFSIFVESFIC